MIFFKPTKQQIFNAEIKDFKKIFTYPEYNIYYIQTHPDEVFVGGTWCIKEYGEDWYNHAEFWMKFIEVITPPHVTMDVYIDEHGEDFISEFLLNFKDQIIWAEFAVNRPNELHIPYYDIDDNIFLHKFLNYSK